MSSKPLKFRISFEIPPLEGQEDTIIKALKLTMPIAENIKVEKIMPVNDYISAEKKLQEDSNNGC